MASELQQRKTSVVFDAMDVNSDGFLERGDFEALTDRWLAVRGEVGSDHLREIMMGWWEVLHATSDQDRDQKVALKEVLATVDRLGAMLDRVAATAESMFDAVDEDGDGQVSAEEYGRMINAWTGRAAPAEAAFSHLDLDGDGWLTRSEFVRHWVEFWAGDDETAPGTYMFGEI